MPRPGPPDGGDPIDPDEFAHAKTSRIQIVEPVPMAAIPIAPRGTAIDADLSTREVTSKRTLALAAAEIRALTTALVGDEGDQPRYDLLDVLGAGGMGEVRLAKDRRLGREVALKTLLPDQVSTESARKRFIREARVQGQLEHPSVVPVYDLGSSDDGGFFFTMRRVRGLTLEQIVKRLAQGSAELATRYSRRKLLTAFVSVCLAVDYAHARGVLHRDLKPANVMLGDFGEVYVLDWGIAKGVAAAEPSAEAIISHQELTAKGHVMGTAAYASPEQITGHRDELDARTDVYGLGLILFEMLAHEPLYGGTRLAEILDAKFGDIDARPSKRVRDVSPELDAICVRATAQAPKDRYQTARDLGDAIERYLDGDRDLARRREIAAEHASAARASIIRARQKGATPDAAEAARAQAMGELVRALAFDPADQETRSLMLALLTDVPEAVPAEAETEMARGMARARKHASGIALIAAAGYVIILAAALASSARTPIGWAALAGAAVLAIAFSWWVWSRVDVALGRAERRLFLSAWQLRKLIPEATQAIEKH